MATMTDPITRARLALNKSYTYAKEKTAAWFETRNPLLGGWTPSQMIGVGRGAQLLEFIQETLDENAPPPSPETKKVQSAICPRKMSRAEYLAAAEAVNPTPSYEEDEQ